MFFVLFACLKFVVRFLKTIRVRTKVLLTLVASDPKFTHAFCCFSCNWFIISVFLFHIYLSLLNTHNVAAVATDKVRILLHEVSQNDFVVLFSLLSQIGVEFLFMD